MDFRSTVETKLFTKKTKNVKTDKKTKKKTVVNAAATN